MADQRPQPPNALPLKLRHPRSAADRCLRSDGTGHIPRRVCGPAGLAACPVTRKSAGCQLTRPVPSFCHLSWPVLTDDTASTRALDRSARHLPGCVHWQIVRRTLWRADFDDARHLNPLPLKKARPGQGRHTGPRCLSPDTAGAAGGVTASCPVPAVPSYLPVSLSHLRVSAINAEPSRAFACERGGYTAIVIVTIRPHPARGAQPSATRHQPPRSAESAALW
jgi:hypothetical protein